MYSAMTRMIRKQIYIRADQDKMLKRRAKELGVTESDVIRQGIDLTTNRQSTGPKDPEAWAKALEFMRERAKIKAPQTGRSWTRDELYDRLDRFSDRH